MAVASGVDGSVTFAQGYVQFVTAWTLDIAVEDVDTTAIGDAWRSHTTGLKEWSGTYTVQTEPTSMGTETLTALAIGNTPSSGTFAFADTSGEPGEFTGNIMVTGVSTNVAVGSGANTMTFTFVGSGALTYQNVT